MSELTQQTLAQVAWLNAISEPTRLTIIRALAGGASKTVTELSAVCEMPPSNLSAHLRKLNKAGVLAFEKDGSARQYSLTKAASVKNGGIELTHSSGLTVILPTV